RADSRQPSVGTKIGDLEGDRACRHLSTAPFDSARVYGTERIGTAGAGRDQSGARAAVSISRPFKLCPGRVRRSGLSLWEIFGRRVNPLFLSYPSAIGRAFVQLLGSGEFERQALGSLQVFAIGLSAALAVGIAFGLIMGRYRLAEYVLDPYVYALDA